MTDTQVTRLVEITTQASQVQISDYIHGLPIKDIQPANDEGTVLRIKAYDGLSGVDMHVTANQPVTIIRYVPVADDECVVCGRPRKYKDMCPAHYQAARRAARSVPGPGQNSTDVPIPFEE